MEKARLAPGIHTRGKTVSLALLPTRRAVVAALDDVQRLIGQIVAAKSRHRKPVSALAIHGKA
jgi:hypothetical protein